MPQSNSLPNSQRPRFSLAGLLVAMLAMAVTFAATHYLVRGGPGVEGVQLAGLLMLLAAPPLLLAAVSVIVAVWRLTKRRG